MIKDLLNGIKILIDIPDAIVKNVFPLLVKIDSYGAIISKVQINDLNELKNIENYWSQFNLPQYELNKTLKDLGYN